ncbi:MAG TPA: alcohol dehydrogenase catalytic domain-containing protein, partial [Gemmatimonadales bacterium]|nr:alcohol dehydrogenase catalytic domain-containing protein [Gemmatimonadales bacterium]
MRALVYTAAGGPEVMAIREVPTPAPGQGQVRVRVRAAGLNRADIYQRRGGYPAPPGWPADIPGLEYAGDVDLVGPGVTRWRPGDRVMGLVGGGGQAEAVVVR